MPSFLVHNADFASPQEFVLADTTVAERCVISGGGSNTYRAVDPIHIGRWIQYIARLQADSLMALLDDDKRRNQRYVPENSALVAFYGQPR
eukprot:1419767-Pyramimonas_sp.AAC.1